MLEWGSNCCLQAAKKNTPGCVYVKSRGSQLCFDGSLWNCREMLQSIHPFLRRWMRSSFTRAFSIVKLFSHRDRRAFTLVQKRKKKKKRRESRDTWSAWLWMSQSRAGAVQEAPTPVFFFEEPNSTSFRYAGEVRRPGWIITGDLESKEETEGLAETEGDPSERHQLATWLTTWLPILQIWNHVAVWGSLCCFISGWNIMNES